MRIGGDHPAHVIRVQGLWGYIGLSRVKGLGLEVRKELRRRNAETLIVSHLHWLGTAATRSSPIIRPNSSKGSASPIILP